MVWLIIYALGAGIICSIFVYFHLQDNEKVEVVDLVPYLLLSPLWPFWVIGYVFSKIGSIRIK